SLTPGINADQALASLAQAMLALRSAGELTTACAIAGSCAVQGAGASEWRLLRLDPRSGALSCLDSTGVETPYAAEAGGAVERCLRDEQPSFLDGDQEGSREELLWVDLPGALATIPLAAAGTVCGVLLVAYAGPHRFAHSERMLLQTLGDGLALAL